MGIVYKVGDKVKINKGSNYYGIHDDHNPAESVGTITEVLDPDHENHCITVRWKGYHTNVYKPTDLEPAESTLLWE